MESVAHYRSDVTASAIVSSPGLGFRLSLKPDRAAKGFFDGGWWPRSAEPVAEFSALVCALVDQLGAVDRIGFSLDVWDMAPRRLVVQEGTVWLHGFRGLNRHTIVVIGPMIRRLMLLVVPPDTNVDTAERALARAAAPNNIDDADQILAASGVRRLEPTAGIPGPREHEQR